MSSRVRPFLLAVGLTLGLVLAADRVAFTQRSNPPGLQTRTFSTTTQTRPLTASVLGTFIYRGDAIELLVLWRGAPGWLFGSEHSRSSGSASTYNLTYEIGGVRLDLAYDRTGRTVNTNGIETALPLHNNIVMVDGVGSDKVSTKVTAADLSFSGNPEVAALLKRSPEAVAFLRCDAVTSNPLQARINSLVCDGLK